MSGKKIRLFAIGNRGLMVGFKSLGIEVFEAGTEEELRKAVEGLETDDVVLVTENLLVGIGPELYKDRWIIPIPERKRTGFGSARIKRMVERAVGMELR